MKKALSFVLLLVSSFILSSCSDSDDSDKKGKEERVVLEHKKKDIEEEKIFCFSDVEFYELKDIKEPSGIVFDKERNSLFVVSDEGSVHEISPDGKLLKSKKEIGGDLEGITIDSQSGLLYVAVENEEKILEIKPDDLSIKREFYISRQFEGKTVLEEGGNGIEGIHYDNQTESLFVVNQALDSKKEADASALLEIEFPESKLSSGSVLEIIGYHPFDINDLSAITQKEKAGLYIISDENNKLLYFSFATNEYEEICDLQGDDQEGIAFDESGNIFIAQDSGGVAKMSTSNKP
jgi:uncharacterized protein YjiK